MAFLDNSGDIILDAVLTELGRKKLSNGTFSIVSFGLGDDEINYGSYDLSHPSGSAYYDLEIMQTPVFESLTAPSADIKYGLVTLPQGLEYIPSLVVNSKLNIGVTTAGGSVLRKVEGIYYFAVNTETMSTLGASSTSNWGTDGTGHPYVSLSNLSNPSAFLMVESGIDTPKIAGNETNRNDYILNNGLNDRLFIVKADSRFVSSVYGTSPESTFTNDYEIDASVFTGVMDLVSYSARSTASDFENYKRYNIAGASNLVYETLLVGNDNDVSSIQGPRGTVMGLGLHVLTELTSTTTGTRSSLWSQYGTINSKPDGYTGTSTFDWIDTTIYIQGGMSNSMINVPVRIIRQAS
jgi:hypothetical protein